MKGEESVETRGFFSPAAFVDDLAYVRDPASGQVSVELGHGDGVELSVRA